MFMFVCAKIVTLHVMNWQIMIDYMYIDHTVTYYIMLVLVTTVNIYSSFYIFVFFCLVSSISCYNIFDLCAFVVKIIDEKPIKD